MADRQIKAQGKDTTVNAEGAEKDDSTSTTAGQLTSSNLRHDNTKVAGLANGKRMAEQAANLGTQRQ